MHILIKLLTIWEWSLPLAFSDIDDCLGLPCLHDGTCTDGINSYSCDCAAGFTGNDCETGKYFRFALHQTEVFQLQYLIFGIIYKINILSSPLGAFKPYIVMSILLFLDIDDCVPKPCLHDGTCTDLTNAYTCTCIAGYTGSDCETRMYFWHTKSSFYHVPGVDCTCSCRTIPQLNYLK